MPTSREEAAQRAEAARTNSPGSCQLWTRTLYGAPSAGDQDHDHDYDAVDGWLSEPTSARHVGDRNPPRGVPVAYSGGSHGYGHRAISLGGGKIRSTDAGGSGTVATVDLSWPETHWGLHYTGWSETIDGQPIPGGTSTPDPPGKHRKRRRSYFVDLHPNYQAGFDFNKAHTEGIRAAVIKCTEGEGVNYGTGYASMIAHAQAADLGVAAYHWLHGGDAAYLKRQAQNLAAHIGDKSIPVHIDAERGGASPTVKDIAGFVVAARDLGLNVVGLYLPRWYWSSIGSPSLVGLQDVTLWNSAYGPNVSLSPKAARIANVSAGRWDMMGGKKPQLLQFGSRVKVGGQTVDCDVYRGPASHLSRWFKMPEASTPPPPPPPPREPVTIRHAHSSGRFDRSPKSLETLTDALMAEVDLITVTEVATEARGVKLAEKGWDHFRGPNKPGADECAILWRTATTRLIAADSVQVTDLTYDTVSGGRMAPVHVAIAVLEDLATTRTTLVTVGHYPSAVQGRGGPEGFWNTASPHRTAAHKAAVAGTMQLVDAWVAKYEPDAAAITGDLNLNIANSAIRAWFAQQFQGFEPNWPAKPRGKGTLGHRWIDIAFLGGLRVTAGPVVHSTDASDHRYYIETLTSA